MPSYEVLFTVSFSCLIPVSEVTMAGGIEEYTVPFFGALQASIAVLLTIFAGVIAAQFGLISEESSKDVSKVCVKLFMPALLIVNVGSELTLGTVRIYYLVIVDTE